MEQVNLMQILTELEENSINFICKYHTYANIFKNIFLVNFKPIKYTEEENLKRKSFHEKMSSFIEGVVSSFNSMNEYLKNNELSKEDIEMLNNHIDFAVSQYFFFKYSFDIGKEFFVEEDLNLFQSFTDKYISVIDFLKKRISEHNEKNTTHKLITIEEIFENFKNSDK